MRNAASEEYERMAGGLDTTGRTVAEQVTDRLRSTPVEGGLGLRVSELRADGCRMWLPIPPVEPDLDGRQEAVGVAVALDVLADTAGGVAVSICVGKGLGSPTIELRIDHVAPPAEDAGWMVADSTVPHVAAGAGYATGLVHDDTGRLLARAHGHYVETTPETSIGELPPSDRPGSTFPSIGPRGGPGELLAALAPSADDPADWSLPADSALANPRGHVQGGVLMTLGQLAQRRVQAANLSHAVAPRPLSLQAEYLRPAPIDGTPLRCRTRYVRHGRRFRTLRSELVRADGRIATIVTGLWASGS
ncbi:MAG: PaaI family thioesterase [Pseudonocardia sp.]|nr:PaaI family thioesterase [Pseudonocardia sp.]